MPEAIRIGNAHGFWGDRIEAASEMLAREPDLQYLTLDFLAEVSMSVMCAQRNRDPNAGYAADFVEIVQSLVPYLQQGGQCRIITNAGGLNPRACALACQELLTACKCGDRKIAVVSGDDVTQHFTGPQHERVRAAFSKNMDTGAALDSIADGLMTANAYIGAVPIAKALALGADIVITGRVADPSLTVGPCINHYQWDDDDFDRIAGATVAGHLIECGTQVTGGISTDWLSLQNHDHIAFPIAEVYADGSCVITKPTGSGGSVTEATVKEQLLYEIGDPNEYLSPDAIVSLTSLDVAQLATDRVRVRGARGRAPPETLKVSGTFRRGYWAASTLTIIGERAAQKARLAGETVLQRLSRSGLRFQHTSMDVIGDEKSNEATLRLAVGDSSRESVERFSRSVMSLITAGPPGTTGYAEGRPKVHPLIGFWPCLIPRDSVAVDVAMLPPVAQSSSRQSTSLSTAVNDPSDASSHQHRQPNGTLADLALARSGDKGSNANVGVIARDAKDYGTLRDLLTTNRVAEHFRMDPRDVTRFELPNLAALNFVLKNILKNPIALDAQGKGLGQKMLQIPLPSGDFPEK